LHPGDHPAAELAAATVPLDHLDAVIRLLDVLQGARLTDEAAALASRAAATTPLDDPDGVARLLDALRIAWHNDQAATLARRLPAAGMIQHFLASAGPGFRFGREPDASPAKPWNWQSLS
jgi:hypothetical protein